MSMERVDAHRAEPLEDAELRQLGLGHIEVAAHDVWQAELAQPGREVAQGLVVPLVHPDPRLQVNVDEHNATPYDAGV
eukprot:790426-Pyramimonas_sp.AAC.1